jgi:hypothetical protein
MNNFPWKTDNPSYPDYLQLQFFAYVFGNIHPFTRSEIQELAEFYRLIWDGEREENEKQAKRLELIHALIALKRQKIGVEKNVLQEQIRKLESL